MSQSKIKTNLPSVDGPQSDSSKRSLQYIPALDGLRGVAILLVLLHHTSIRHDATSMGSFVYRNLKSIGWIGVDLFFVLSGFLIGSILIKSHGQKGWLKSFLIRRSLRVLPLYFVVVFVCFNLIVLIPDARLDWLRELSQDQWWYWAHLANFRRIFSAFDPSVANVGWFSTYWSLSIEEHFYLIWPFVIALAGPLRSLRVALVGILMVMVTRACISLGELPDPFIYNNTLTRIDGLLLGTVIAWLKHFRPDRFQKLGYPALAALIVAALAFIIPMLLGVTGGGRKTHYGHLCLYTASIVGSGALVWRLVAKPETDWVSRLFSFGLLKSFGKYSYAIYVFNKPILFGLGVITSPYFGKSPTWRCLIIFCIVAGLCWIAGFISWRLIEAPFLTLKAYFPSPTRPGTSTEQVEATVLQSTV
ncbi:MAG: acyltransferase [Planctomycetota bacterium]